MDTDVTGQGQEIQRTIDARQAWSALKLVHAEEGCAEVSFSNFPANALSSTNMSINVLVPQETGVCRDILYEMSGTITVTGTNSVTVDNLLGNAADGYIPLGFAECGLDQMCNNEQITFGGISNQVNRNQVGVELGRLNTPSSILDNYLSGCLEGQQKDIGVSFLPWLNSNRNVLQQPYDKINSDQTPYGRTLGLKLTANTATSATLSYHVFFTSKVPPFVSNGQQTVAIRGLQNILLQLSFTQNFVNIVNMLNYAPVAGLTITAMTLNTPSLCQVWMKFITPSAHAMMPLSIFENDYEYAQIQAWSQQNNGTVSAGATNYKLNFQQVSGSVIPERLLIGARTSYTQRDGSTPVFYYPIADNGVTLRFNNRPFLNTANQRQLFEMSRINGLSQCDYPQFIGQNVSYDATGENDFILGGGFLVVNPARDCGIIQQGLTNGSIANWTIQGSININNQTAEDDPNVELFIIAIYNGRVHVEQGKAVARLGYFSDGEAERVFADASHAPISDDMVNSFEPMGDAGHHGFYGGGFWSSVGNFFKKAGKFLWKHKGTIAKVATTVAPLVGLGEQGKGYDPRSMDKKSIAQRYLRR